jgi:SsrA-binding protein
MYNKKANFLFNFEYKVEAGMELNGKQVKQLRNGIGISGAYIIINNNQVYVRNLFDSLVKLLLKKKEILKIISYLSSKSNVIVPIEVYRKRYFKILIGVGKYKQEHDRREELKKKAMEMDFKRNFPLI